MTVLAAARAFCPRGVASPMWLCCALLAGIGIPQAKADFIGYYSPVNFTLTNNGGGIDSDGNPTANGSASFSPDGTTLTLTGTNDGSALPGWTDLTIPALGSGWFQFAYVFATLDLPTYEYAGYLLGSEFVKLADTDGDHGFVSIPVTSGQLLGFRAGSLDSQGGLNGVLTVTDFSAPLPEPGTLQMLLLSATALAAWTVCRRFIRKRPS